MQDDVEAILFGDSPAFCCINRNDDQFLVEIDAPDWAAIRQSGVRIVLEKVDDGIVKIHVRAGAKG